MQSNQRHSQQQQQQQQQQHQFTFTAPGTNTNGTPGAANGYFTGQSPSNAPGPGPVGGAYYQPAQYYAAGVGGGADVGGYGYTQTKSPTGGPGPHFATQNQYASYAASAGAGASGGQGYINGNGITNGQPMFQTPSPGNPPQILKPSAPIRATAHGNKKRRKSNNDELDPDDDDSQDDDDGGGRTRLPGACANCKSLKVRCDFPPDAEACKKCRSSGKECVVPGRKPRKPPAKREELIKQIRDKDAIISQLLEQLEARSPDSLLLTSSSTTATNPTALSQSQPPSAAAQAALKQAEEKREKEIKEWILKAKNSVDQSSQMNLGRKNFGLAPGAANPIKKPGGTGHGVGIGYEPASDDDDDGSGSGFDGEVGDEPVEKEGSVGDAGSTHSRKQSASLPSPHMAAGGALPATAPLGFIENEIRGLQRRSSNGKGKKHKVRQGSGTAVVASDSDSDSAGSAEGNEEGEKLGVGNLKFFKNTIKPYLGVNGEMDRLPTILAKKLVSPAEVVELFTTYFDCMNLSTCLLDEKLYTPEKTVLRSHFLFEVICAISSRYHPQRSSLYPILMHQARLHAGSALIGGRKTLETVQAYILLSLYPIPARRWSEDRSWMYLGCAIRMATDLNLHHPPVLDTGETATRIETIMHIEEQSREILNRTRGWLSCFNLDKATSTQFGKPSTLREDWMFPLLQKNMSEGGKDWWCPTPFSIKFDIHLCAYSALLREIAAFHAQIYSDPTNPTGLNENIPFEELTYQFDDKIAELGKDWFNRVDGSMDTSDPQCVFTKGLLQLEFDYNRLVALSFGFQHAFKRGAIQKENLFLTKCYNAASKVVKVVVDQLAEQKYMRYCPENIYIFSTFASAFLLKLLRPKFSHYLDVHQHAEILDLVERLIRKLNDIAVDDRHAPRLYSRFLNNLLKKGRKILAKGSQASSASSPSVMDPTTPPTRLDDSFGAPPPPADQQMPPPPPPQQQQQQQQPPQPPFSMDGVQNSLPQNVWPYGISDAGDGDTLMSMHMFGEQFWDHGLLPGFAWSNDVPAHMAENQVRSEPGMYEPDFLQNQFLNTRAPGMAMYAGPEDQLGAGWAQVS